MSSHCTACSIHYGSNLSTKQLTSRGTTRWNFYYYCWNSTSYRTKLRPITVSSCIRTTSTTKATICNRVVTSSPIREAIFKTPNRISKRCKPYLTSYSFIHWTHPRWDLSCVSVKSAPPLLKAKRCCKTSSRRIYTCCLMFFTKKISLRYATSWHCSRSVSLIRSSRPGI